MQEKSLFNYFKECITSKYIKFEGRARRREYWGFILFSIIILLSVLIVGSLIGDLLGGGFRFMGIVPCLSTKSRLLHPSACSERTPSARYR